MSVAKAFKGTPCVRASVIFVFLASCVSAGAQELRVTQIQRTGDEIVLHWTDAGPNLAYTVQSRSAINDLWLIASAHQTLPVPTTQWTGPWSPENGHQFYRILAVPAADRGAVLSSESAASYVTLLIQFFLNNEGIPLTAEHDVEVFRVTYETIDPWGAQTLATGVVAVPSGVTDPLPLYCYQHGTMTLTNEAPSALDLESEYTIGLIAATTGYVAVLPDYLGLGGSPGLHPYHHARSEATAGVDLLRAARTVCADNGIALNGQLFICGYSQGGHAAMALHRELESFHTDEFTVTASAPMAGAYDLSGLIADDFLSDRTKPQPYYYLYMLAAFREVYSLAPTLADLLAPPYDSTLPPLLNGNFDGADINAAMPGQPIDVLKPEYVAAFRTDPNHPLRQALRDNDLYEWTPQAPMRLYSCSGDADVPPASSQFAYDQFVARGAPDVSLIDPLPNAGHGECSMPSLLQAKLWFDSLVQ